MPAFTCHFMLALCLMLSWQPLGPLSRPASRSMIAMTVDAAVYHPHMQRADPIPSPASPLEPSIPGNARFGRFRSLLSAAAQLPFARTPDTIEEEDEEEDHYIATHDGDRFDRTPMPIPSPPLSPRNPDLSSYLTQEDIYAELMDILSPTRGAARSRPLSSSSPIFHHVPNQLSTIPEEDEEAVSSGEETELGTDSTLSDDSVLQYVQTLGKANAQPLYQQENRALPQDDDEDDELLKSIMTEVYGSEEGEEDSASSRSTIASSQEEEEEMGAPLTPATSIGSSEASLLSSTSSMKTASCANNGQCPRSPTFAKAASKVGFTLVNAEGSIAKQETQRTEQETQHTEQDAIPYLSVWSPTDEVPSFNIPSQLPKTAVEPLKPIKLQRPPARSFPRMEAKKETSPSPASLSAAAASLTQRKEAHRGVKLYFKEISPDNGESDEEEEVDVEDLMSHSQILSRRKAERQEAATLEEPSLMTHLLHDPSPIQHTLMQDMHGEPLVVISNDDYSEEMDEFADMPPLMRTSRHASTDAQPVPGRQRSASDSSTDSDESMPKTPESEDLGLQFPEPDGVTPPSPRRRRSSRVIIRQSDPPIKEYFDLSKAGQEEEEEEEEVTILKESYVSPVRGDGKTRKMRFPMSEIELAAHQYREDQKENAEYVEYMLRTGRKSKDMCRSKPELLSDAFVESKRQYCIYNHHLQNVEDPEIMFKMGSKLSNEPFTKYMVARPSSLRRSHRPEKVPFRTTIAHTSPASSLRARPDLDLSSDEDLLFLSGGRPNVRWSHSVKGGEQRPVARRAF